MNDSTHLIPLAGLALGFVPVALVALVLWRWSAGAAVVGWASLRMVVQLLLIGYVLTFIFESGRLDVMALVLVVMLVASSWIALRPLAARSLADYRRALAAIGAAGFATLALVVVGVLGGDAWQAPRIVIPIAGMIFSSAMNSVSLAAERFVSETGRGAALAAARRDALKAALIPLTNALLAVGLVALPGMMTGQILAGVEPAVAVRYQILVMCMSFGAAGLAAAGYLTLAARGRG
ncbi:MAG: ABC transporter permease [Gammaproteobacteria bacterium]